MIVQGKEKVGVEDYLNKEPHKPDRNIALLVSCSDYSTLREKSSDFKAFNDVKSAPEEVESVKENLKRMGFKDEDIKHLSNPKCDDVKDAFDDIMEECWVSNVQEEKILFYFYFIGHGSQESSCQLILNGYNEVFPIEKMLKIVAGFKDCYVLALLDCTRKRVDPTKWTI